MIWVPRPGRSPGLAKKSGVRQVLPRSGGHDLRVRSLVLRAMIRRVFSARGLSVCLLVAGAVWLIRARASVTHLARQLAALPSPSWPPIALAVLAIVASYACSAWALAAAADRKLPFGKTLTVQLAAAVANRVTVGGVGGAIVNGRYLASEGVTLGGTGAAISLTGVAHAIVALVGVVVMVPVAGRFPVVRSALALRVSGVPVVPGVVVVVLLLAWPVWHLVRAQVRRRAAWRAAFCAVLRDATAALKEIARAPRRMALLLGATAGVKIMNMLALLATTWAFDGDIADWRVAAVYFVGVPLAEVVPTPGGLGTVDAVLVAGLARASGTSLAAVVAAVVVFRLLTFWAPIVPGLVASGVLRRRAVV